MQATTVAVQATISGLQTTIATSQDFRSAVQETLFLMQATQSAIQETLSSMRVTQSTVQETLSSMQETLLGFSESSTSSPVYPTLQPVVGDSLASHSASTRSPRLSTGTSASDDILRNRRIPSAKPLSLAAIGKLKESTGDVQLRVKSGRPKTGSVSTNRSTTLATVQEATVADETEVAGWEDLDSSDYQDFVEENSQPEVGLVNVRTALYESLTAGPV
ncbi:hypothetical protein BC629DRAFT_1596856 [Irpex lacteus]|nr:hypothetical protein BC629DRAFT_1596856 [Irpex lacteus]